MNHVTTDPSRVAVKILQANLMFPLHVRSMTTTSWVISDLLDFFEIIVSNTFIADVVLMIGLIYSVMVAAVLLSRITCLCTTVAQAHMSGVLGKQSRVRVYIMLNVERGSSL
jgi:hypothetical protein